MAPDKNSDKFIEQIKDRLVEELNPRRILLFGSRARGDAHKGSDVDIYIEMETAESYARRCQKVSSIFRPRNWSLDAFVFTPEEIAADKDRNGTIINLVEREGKLIYERR